MMKKNRFKVMGILLLFCLLLSGCSGNWKDYFHTEESLKQEAQRALEEKYDEEFVIHDVWVVAQSAFGAMCSPKNDMDVVFEVELYKDGSGMYRDEYIQGIVSQQLSERIQAKLQKVFGNDCYVKAHFYGGLPTIEDLIELYKGETPTMDYFKNLTVEEYYELDENPYLGFKIIINKDNLDYCEEKAQEEFDCFSKLFDGEPVKEAGFTGYFVDESKLNECKEYFQRNNKAWGDFDYMVDDEIEFGFGIIDEKINIAFEEYNKVRKETGINE